jgi:hypothetical protein
MHQVCAIFVDFPFQNGKIGLNGDRIRERSGKSTAEPSQSSKSIRQRIPHFVERRVDRVLGNDRSQVGITAVHPEEFAVAVLDLVDHLLIPEAQELCSEHVDDILDKCSWAH